MPLPPKSARESAVEMTEVVLPSDGNVVGAAFGGKVMQWIDICAAIAAQRHARRVAITASIDELHFLAPIIVGYMVILRGRVNATFRSSMEVGVEVHSENVRTGERRRCCTALTTFVAVDDQGKSTEVPPLLLESDDERALHEAAAARRQARLSHRKAAPR